MRALILGSLFVLALAAPPAEFTYLGVQSDAQKVMPLTSPVRQGYEGWMEVHDVCFGNEICDEGYEVWVDGSDVWVDGSEVWVDENEEWADEDLAWVEGENEFVKQEGIVYQRIWDPALSSFYQLRVKTESPTLCDNTVKQQSGYLDIDDEKHLFFWFFESRKSPSTAPLVLWLNGGPGCSSSTGLLFELGPCRVVDGGQGTVFNNFSWNEEANIIFLDQPVNVGYSYSSDGSNVDTSPAAAVDVWSFLELFLKKFPQYSKLPFHVAAESYGGTYAPNIASVIHKKNQELALAPVSDLIPINLASIMLGNGLTDPLRQFAAVPEFACNGPYPVYDDPEGPECQSLRSKVPTCQRLIQTCYDWDTRLVCVPAGLYCWQALYGPFQQLGLNPYDVRRTCDPQKDGSLCYKQMDWIDAYLGRPEVKKELGASPSINYTGCNMQVNLAFKMKGDDMHNSAVLLPELLASGIKVLVYAGNADFMCNFMGNLDWMLELENVFQEEFVNANNTPWVTRDSGKVAGEVRSAGGGGYGAGNFTYVVVYEAGHMVPYDQPEASLDLFTRWIKDEPLAFSMEDRP